MKPVIVDIRGIYAAALTEDGSIVKMRNRNYAVGQQIEMPVTSHANTRRLLAMAACLALLLSGLTGYAYFTPYSYVSLDVNPSLEFTLNRFDYVLSVGGVNDDGKALTESFDISNLKNRSINYAVSLTVDELFRSGYLDNSSGGGIVIATSANNVKKAERLASELKETLEDGIEDDNDIDSGNDIPASTEPSPITSIAPNTGTTSPNRTPDTSSPTVSPATSPSPGSRKDKDKIVIESFDVSRDYVDKAKEKGVSPGKLHLIEKLQESANTVDDDIDIDIDYWLTKPVKDIMNATKKFERAHKEQSKSDKNQEYSITDSDNSQNGKPEQQSKENNSNRDNGNNNSRPPHSNENSSDNNNRNENRNKNSSDPSGRGNRSDEKHNNNANSGNGKGNSQSNKNNNRNNGNNSRNKNSGGNDGGNDNSNPGNSGRGNSNNDNSGNNNDNRNNGSNGNNRNSGNSGNNSKNGNSRNNKNSNNRSN